VMDDGGGGDCDLGMAPHLIFRQIPEGDYWAKFPFRVRGLSPAPPEIT